MTRTYPVNSTLDKLDVAGPCLWTVLCQPVVDDLYGNHAPSQTFPSHGGRTADTIGKWDSFAGDSDCHLRPRTVSMLQL